jgi:hypothetical protein
MLAQNIWVELGLVNGTTGTVEDVVWKEHADIKKDQPQALLIAVDGYNGPALYTQHDGRKVTPVFLYFVSGRVQEALAHGVNFQSLWLLLLLCIRAKA